MNGITNWFQNIDMGDPNWVMAICAILTIIGGAGAFIVKKLIGLVSKASRKETPAEGPATPITNDEIDAMFPATTPATHKPPMPPKFRIDIDESGERFAKLVAQRFGLGTIQRNNEVPHRTGTRELNEEHGGTMRQTAYMHRHTFHASHHATSNGFA